VRQEKQFYAEGRVLGLQKGMRKLYHIFIREKRVMKTDTKKFKQAVGVAIRKSREKWNPNSETCACSGDTCGFCLEAMRDGGLWDCDCENTGCEGLFFVTIGLSSCLKGIGKCSTDTPVKWKRACTIMHKRFDKIAKLYGVDA
jgi:hypothetical protein